MRLHRVAGIATALLITLSGGLHPAQAQGFGKVKRKVVLHRKLPPIVHLPGVNIAVNVTSRADRGGTDVSQQLRDSLETEILKYDNRLNIDKAKPDAVVSCVITSFVAPPPKYAVRNSVGLNTKPQRYEEVSGTLQIAYQTKAAKTGRVLDSENVKAHFSGEYDAAGESNKLWDKTIKKGLSKIRPGKKDDAEMDTPPTQEELQQILVARAVSQIASRVVRTDEPVQVLLARGKLDDWNKYFESGLWNRAQEALETMQPLPAKDDDAYRLYNIGVLYEAQAYQSEDILKARRFLEQAAINYGKALDANPSEKYFLEPQNRIQTALAHYKKLETTQPAGGGKSTVSSGGEPLTNSQVIELAKAGMDEQNLIEAIKTAPAVNFDFSVAGQLQLVKAGIKGRVLTTMRERAGMKSTAPRGR